MESKTTVEDKTVEDKAAETAKQAGMVQTGPPDSYVALDLEMTGLNPKEDDIIEIGAVKVCQGEIVDTYSSFVLPAKKLAERITELTGITQKDVEGALPCAEAIVQILDFIGELPLLGHSILLDYSFLKRAADNQKLIFEKEGIDTLRIARCCLKEAPSKRLEELCARYGIRHRAHRALADAQATMELYCKMAEAFYNQENQTLFEPVKLIYKVKRESPVTKRQKERLYELVEKHRLTVEYDIEKLTRNQASRYTDKILEKYGR